ncbi:uncharacterized protein EMH_0001940 [Eimeria mitis]|uniref:Uncharacterized protein n=1 Tax=Eimeria mitis TaxID=44415 RepID=U6JT85_9EIME|nr:uncharacterized protein EMH_0001940 [Eimeria mitis]CDJ28634.1 hypothetical protein, conserved [Eimeria mitis]
METAGALFGQLLAIGALPLSISIADGDTHTRRRHSGISKVIGLPKHLVPTMKRFYSVTANEKHAGSTHANPVMCRLFCSTSATGSCDACSCPASSLEDRGGSNGCGSSNSDALPVQQQALVVRGAASLVLQQWVLLAADALQLLRRLLQPEKQHHRRNSSSNNADNHQLLGRQQQQDSRRKRVRTTEAQREDDGEEQQEDADEAADAIWERAAQLQLQQQQGEEESQQRLKRLGSVFATHLQEAESSVRANRDSAGLLLQRGAPDLFSACWAAVATPLRSGSTRPGQQQQQQIGSHERLLAAAGEAHAPGMSWRRWAFGGPEPHLPFPSAAAASSAAAAAAAGKSASAAAGEIGGGREEDPGVESADFADMWGPLPEEEQQEEYEAPQQQHQQQQQEEGMAEAQDISAGPKATRRRGQGHGVQLDTNISRNTASRTSGDRAFPTLLSNSSTMAAPPPLCKAAKYLAATTAEVHELYAVHPVANLYEWLQQQLLLPGGKPAWSLQQTPAAAAAEGRNAVAGIHLNKLSSYPGPQHSAAAAQTNEAQQQSSGRGGPWPRRDWEGDFTLYTEAELQQQPQQQDSSSGRRRSGDLLGSGEYVEVLRGIFDSSSMQQRATQTRLTQVPRESEASSTSRLGSSRRASGLSAASSEASLEALAYGDFPDFEGCPTEFSEDQQQQQQQQHASAAAAAEQQQQQQQQEQQQQQNESTIPLSRLLPRGRVDPRTACCTFSHLLLLHRHGSIRLEQQQQVLTPPSNKPYPELTHPDVSGHLFAGAGEPAPQQQQQQQQEQQQQQNESTIPLSRLLPRGRVDPRTACCTFSHLLLLHRHGSIRLEQQQQVLTPPSNKPYPELFVHVTQQWRTAEDVAGVQQPDKEPPPQQQDDEQQQQAHPQQEEQQQTDKQRQQGSPDECRQTDDKEVSSLSRTHKEPPPQQQEDEQQQQAHPQREEQQQTDQQRQQGSPDECRQTDDKEVSSLSSEQKQQEGQQRQHDEEQQQRRQQKQTQARGASRATGLTLGAARSRKAPRAP